MKSRIKNILIISENYFDFEKIAELLRPARVKRYCGLCQFSLHYIQSIKPVIEPELKASADVVIYFDDKGSPPLPGAIKGLKEQFPSAPIVVVGNRDPSGNCGCEGLLLGAQDYVPYNSVETLLERSICYAAERHKAILQLERIKEEALDVARTKGAFLAHMSHEIKTPLTVIEGFAEKLKDDQLSKVDQYAAASAIEKNVYYLTRIIGNILETARAEAGRSDVHIADVDLFDILQDIEVFFQSRAREKGIEFKIQYEFPLPRFVLTDDIRFRQILINIISNAVKFTNLGYVHINIRFQINNNQLIIEVKDSGIGISPEETVHLFKPFRQANSNIEQKFGGTGLGLSISKELISRLGGDIEVDSVYGKGTTFTISLQQLGLDDSFFISELPQTIRDSQRNLTIANSKKEFIGHVLVAEDNEDTQKLLCWLLKKHGAFVTLVSTGIDAVKKAKALNPDLILMDVQMPLKDGYSATKELRAGGYLKPIVALTAGALTGEANKAVHQGCDGFLQKPFKQQEFIDLISCYLKSRPKIEDGHIAETAETKMLGDGVALDDEESKIFEEFALSLPQKVNEIADAFDQNDLIEFRRLVHKLKAAGLFGFPIISSLATQIEEQLEQNNTEALKYTLQAMSLVARSYLSSAR